MSAVKSLLGMSVLLQSLFKQSRQHFEIHNAMTEAPCLNGRVAYNILVLLGGHATQNLHCF